MSGTEDVSSTDVDRGTREISVTRAAGSRESPGRPSAYPPAHCPYRSFITSTIISSVFTLLPARRAGHRSRRSLVVTVVVVAVAFVFAVVLSMCVLPFLTADPISSHRNRHVQDLHQSPRATRRPQSPYRCPPTTASCSSRPSQTGQCDLPSPPQGQCCRRK